MSKKKIAVLGSTGSIGTQTLNVISRHPDLFEAHTLTAGRNAELLIKQARAFKPDTVVIADDTQYNIVQEALSDLPIKVYAGADAVSQVVTSGDIDVVLTAMVGFSGLRPTVEAIGPLTKTRHVGLLATVGTVNSGSYGMEIHKLWPDVQLTGVACPMWVPLVENYEFDSPGADYFVQKRIGEIFRADPDIDTLILGCTHYPLLMNKIVKYIPTGVRIVTQGEYVAKTQSHIHI